MQHTIVVEQAEDYEFCAPLDTIVVEVAEDSECILYNRINGV